VQFRSRRDGSIMRFVEVYELSLATDDLIQVSTLIQGVRAGK